MSWNSIDIYSYVIVIDLLYYTVARQHITSLYSVLLEKRCIGAQIWHRRVVSSNRRKGDEIDVFQEHKLL